MQNMLVLFYWISLHPSIQRWRRYQSLRFNCVSLMFKCSFSLWYQLKLKSLLSSVFISATSFAGQTQSCWCHTDVSPSESPTTFYAVWYKPFTALPWIYTSLSSPYSGTSSALSYFWWMQRCESIWATVSVCFSLTERHYLIPSPRGVRLLFSWTVLGGIKNKIIRR